MQRKWTFCLFFRAYRLLSMKKFIFLISEQKFICPGSNIYRRKISIQGRSVTILRLKRGISLNQKSVFIFEEHNRTHITPSTTCRSLSMATHFARMSTNVISRQARLCIYRWIFSANEIAVQILYNTNDSYS